jgi:hypothetical protein
MIESARQIYETVVPAPAHDIDGGPAALNTYQRSRFRTDLKAVGMRM